MAKNGNVGPIIVVTKFQLKMRCHERLWPLKVSLWAVLDFRLGLVRHRIQVSLDRILTVDWRKEVAAGRIPITQTIGRAASEIGLHGMIVPSAVDPNGHNVLVFTHNLRSDCEIKVLHEDRLRRMSICIFA